MPSPHPQHTDEARVRCHTGPGGAGLAPDEPSRALAGTTSWLPAPAFTLRAWASQSAMWLPARWLPQGTRRQPPPRSRSRLSGAGSPRWPLPVPSPPTPATTAPCGLLSSGRARCFAAGARGHPTGPQAAFPSPSCSSPFWVEPEGAWVRSWAPRPLHCCPLASHPGGL